MLNMGRIESEPNPAEVELPRTAGPPITFGNLCGPGIPGHLAPDIGSENGRSQA
jgi:hypothetical protein